MKKNVNLNDIYDNVKNKCKGSVVVFFEAKNGGVYTGVFRPVFEGESTKPYALYVECFEGFDKTRKSELVFKSFRDRMFLDKIYTDFYSRNLGLGKTLLFLSEDILKGFGVREIVGEFGPHDFYVKMSLDELRKNALAFYKSAGYEIFDFDKFYECPELYPQSLQDVFFCPDLLYKKLDEKTNINIIEAGEYFVEESLAEKLGLVKNLGE